MTIKELISELSKMNPEHQIMLLDSFNGGGEPREINITPTIYSITQENEDNGADCEGLVGQEVVIMGYGNY